MLARISTPSQAPTRKFVRVVRDGSLYRWQRQDSPALSLTSREAFVNFDAALVAARNVAASYGAQLVAAVSL